LVVKFQKEKIVVAKALGPGIDTGAYIAYGASNAKGITQIR
jgi:hypothetical protein